ncbi:MAG: hypothetical protein HS108_09830 [Planctomycetes bacterium]|jgi:hypothetical protein|nr:hypothetical protein [Planctomycetota bacterium]MCL4728865.1 hypothetical protein [Planctomycetota bacterium]
MKTCRLAVLALVFAACTADPAANWNEDQRAVHATMLAWSGAASRGDSAAMWDMLTPDSQDWFLRELTGRGGVQETVRQLRAALEPGSLAPPTEQERVRKVLATLPEKPETMTARDYYQWRIRSDLVPEKTARTAQLFAKTNIRDISVIGEKATVVLVSGDPDRYSFKKVGGDWKFDLPPSILRALETVRRQESGEE